jgi:hypothetical protein
MKHLEQLLKSRLESVQLGLHTVETELRARAEFIRKGIDEAQVGAADRVKQLRGMMTLEALKTRFGADKLDELSKAAERLLADGVRRSEAVIDKLGFARLVELPVFAQIAHTPTAKEAFGRVQARIEAIRGRFEASSAAPVVAVEKNLE